MSDVDAPAVPDPDSGPGLFNDLARQRRQSIERKVELERVRQLFERTAEPMLATIVGAGLITWALWHQLGNPAIWWWFALKQITAVGRLLECVAFSRADSPQLDTRAWWLRHGVGGLIDGLGWGLLGWYFVPSGDPWLDGVIAGGLVAVASVGVFTLTSYNGHAMRFMLGALLPLVASQVVQGGAVSWLVACGLLVYLALLWREGRRSERHMLELLRLRFENAAIAEDRQRALLLAEHSSATKSRFLAMVSHELRTPLNGILGMTQLMRDGTVSAQQARQLTVVQQSAGHLQTLIEDLLDISRADAGRLKIEPAPARVADLVREVTDLLSPVATDKGLRFMVSLLHGLPDAAMLDAQRVKQVLHNLLGNALKFTAAGQVELKASLEGDFLRFEVRDSGVGIPLVLQQRIFDPFEQGDGPSEQRRGGTGLGLTISRQLAVAMGGNVTCASVPGHGATFTFTVAYRPAQAPVRQAAPAAPARPLQGRVLIVEDNPVNLMVASAMVERLGLAWESADDGQVALGRLAQTSYDLVLMDCQMPVLDGLAATRAWREREAAAGQGRLPIVALTANAVPGDREACTAAGMDDYLSKPFTIDTLQTVLARYLAGGKGP
ncbi:MAG: hybrid sensor histidine kinase/response regulator [Burkholderiales bacterium PBB6]|nr:MAG: hybrid sensor histidine kinase/response regulator [Burkholderiales bacterium PBB6]